MWKRFRSFIEHGLSPVLIASFMLGLFVPGLERLPGWLVLWILGVMIFFACARITMAEIRRIRLREAALFYGVRFVVLPVVLFLVGRTVLPEELSYGVLLLALTPAGASVGVLCAVMGGSIALGLGIAVVSSLLAPFVLPSVFALFGQSLDLDVFGIFKTLSLMIFLPVMLYFGAARRVPPVRRWVQAQSRFVSVLLLGGMLAVVVASRRSQFLDDIPFVLICLAVLFGLFGLFYVFGWIFGRRADFAHRISYALSSGAMNNALGISLAFLYFPPQVTLFMVLSEVPWVLCLPLFQIFLKKKQAL